MSEIIDHRSPLSTNKLVALLPSLIVVFMGLFIFLNPFPHVTAFKEIALYSSILLSVILLFSGSFDFSLKSPLTASFFLFTCWALIGLFFAKFKMESLHDFIFHWIKYLCLYYLLINFFSSKKNLIFLSWIIIISAMIFSTWGVVEFYLIQGHRFPHTMINFQENTAHIICFSTIVAILLSIHFISRPAKLYEKVILTYTLFITLSISIMTQRLTIIASLLLCSVALFPRNKKIISFFIVLFIVVLIISPVYNRLSTDSLRQEFEKESARLKIWRTCIEMVKEHPIVGMGFAMGRLWHDEALWKTYSERVPSEWRIPIRHESHNIFISILVRLGFVGLLLFFYILYSFCKMCWMTIHHAKDDFIRDFAFCIAVSFGGYTFMGMFVEALANISAVVFFTILAMMTIVWRLNEQDSEKVRLQL